MKNKCIYIIAVVFGLLFYSCNNILEDQHYTSEQDYENLKSEVLAFAEANGVKVYIQEEVWKKNLPSLESIKNTILETKHYASESTQSNKLQAKYNSPTRLKTGWEMDPPLTREGSFSVDEWIHYDGKTFWCELEVEYRHGHPNESDYVRFPGGTADCHYYNELEVTISDEWCVFYDTSRFLAGCEYEVNIPYTFPKTKLFKYEVTINYNYGQGVTSTTWTKIKDYNLDN